MKTRIALALILAGTAFGSVAQEETEYPMSRAAARLMMEQMGDAALEAQRQHFPKHHNALADLLARIKQGDNPHQTRQALMRTSQQNWLLYNALVRQGNPADWRDLVEMRRDLFALAEEHDGPDLCLAFEYRGTLALSTHANPAYRDPVSAYFARFIASAAHARAAPRAWRPLHGDDLDLLFAAMKKRTEGAALMDALRPDAAAHPRFCEAMIALMDTALSLQGEAGALVWRFLVTADEPGPDDAPAEEAQP